MYGNGTYLQSTFAAGKEPERERESMSPAPHAEKLLGGSRDDDQQVDTTKIRHDIFLHSAKARDRVIGGKTLPVICISCSFLIMLNVENNQIH